jgi:hypothetical protein
MKLTKYITTACIAALFTGCDYLDFDEPLSYLHRSITVF